MKILRSLSIFLILSLMLLTSCKDANTQSQASDAKDNITSSDTTNSNSMSADDFFDGAVDEIPDTAESKNVSSSAPSKVTSSEKVSSTKQEEINYINHNFKYLQNFYSKLTTKDSVTVTFIGGSVTDGMGASSSDKKWPELFCQTLEQKYKTEIDLRRKSLGGTGSYLGAFKYTTDVAPSEYTQPDLLFIEYALNDNYEKATYDEVVKYSETIVRTAYKLNPEVDIVYVLTFDTGLKDKDYDQLRAHQSVAEKYGLMCIKLADSFYKQLKSSSEDGLYFTDGVHPNDEGYRMYADIVIEAVLSDLPRTGVAEPKIVKKTLPQAMSNYYQNPHLVYSNEIDLTKSSGWEYKKADFSWVAKRFNGYITANTAGSKLTLTFEGSHFGLLINKAKDMGKITVSIDGGAPVTVDGYRSSSNPDAVLIADGLSSGKHTAEITLIDKEFQIGGLLLN